MKNFINFVIKASIYIIILLAIFIIFILAYAYIFSAQNNIALEDTVSYIKSVGSELTGITLTDKNSVNLSSNESISNENLTINTSFKNRFYYEQLDDNAKIIYNSFENNIDNLKKDNYKIDYSTKFNDLLNHSNGQYSLNKSFQSALDAFFYDHPELFYIDITKISLLIKYSSFASKTTYTVSIVPQNGNNYLLDSFSSESEVDLAIKQVENARDNIIKSISAKNDYDIALKVHDILVSSLEYDSTFNKPNIHNVYGALTQNSVVCEGYAKAFKYILDSLGIESILVSGDATNSSGKTESHMWNYIKLDGNWYGVDVTWDDPIIIGVSLKNTIRHDYFCKGSDLFNLSHSPSRKISDNGMSFSLPTLSKEKYKK